MVASKNNGGKGQTIPPWFKSFLGESRTFVADHHAFAEATGLALKTLAESMQHLTEEVRELGGRIHQVEIQQERTNERLDRTNEELVRTRRQSANLIGRFIREIRGLRPRR